MLSRRVPFGLIGNSVAKALAWACCGGWGSAGQDSGVGELKCHNSGRLAVPGAERALNHKSCLGFLSPPLD